MTSSESIEIEQLEATPNETASFSTLRGDDDDDNEKDDAKAHLEVELQGEKDARLEERFLWIMVCVILVDVLWFRNAPNAVIPILVLILEAIILFVLARRMGIQEVSALFERVIHGLGQRGTGS